MQILRLVLIALLTGIVIVNFWIIDYDDLWSRNSLWAYVRMTFAVILIILLVNILRHRDKRVWHK